jgi:predicted dehydrogenase
MERRLFLQSAGAAFTAASYQRIYGANGRAGVALIGSGRRGREVMGGFLRTGRADLRVICDVYDVQRERARAALVKSGSAPREFVAHEDALEERGVDAVLIATPDHWHIGIALEALRKGKHIFLEKPATHHWSEGARLLEAARGSGRVCQTGVQQRSGAHYKRVREEYFSRGRLGKIVLVRACWSNFPWQSRSIAAAPKPPGLDWTRFLGATPRYEFNYARYDAWRYFPEYGGGVLSDILNHWADVAQWMMNDARPLEAVCLGGIYQLHDGRVNPDTVNAVVKYKDWNLAFECSVLSIKDDRPGVLFQGTEASLFLARDGFVVIPNNGKSFEVSATEDLTLAHINDFLDAMGGNRPPNAGPETALEGLRPCYLARAAFWRGKRARYDAAGDSIVLD